MLFFQMMYSTMQQREYSSDFSERYSQYSISDTQRLFALTQYHCIVDIMATNALTSPLLTIVTLYN